MKNIVYALFILGIITSMGACKEKPQKQTQKPQTKVVEKPVKDTMTPDTLNKVAEEKIAIPEPPKPEDKYFLIAGSFQSRENAEIFKLRLEEQGYNSNIIERRRGPNNEFFKVSYKSFYDRTEAYAELRNARNSEGRDNVWLLVKR
ncbi:SPOR domain-containing protein [Carboxylicivirga linearis]|uniref:SPOR domain-containing protein n=1 Tax=Carboxylicivirga linearis TaxID=1628157 RepID=A0ABS5JPM5_9BACT|nr:SPOR domain-containing protein [Carboxylicivirga linearis]MBS2096774.1 SPOR domain-containing protein [Carboxylicivirga linearis]